MNDMTKLQKRREALGILRADLATKAQIHIRTLAEIENGRGRTLRSRTQRALAEALVTKPTFLFTAEGVAL